MTWQEKTPLSPLSLSPVFACVYFYGMQLKNNNRLTDAEMQD